jgi:predicted dehydrogenase
MPSLVQWGVLSTARIGTKKVIPGMQKSTVLKVAGIASRDLHRAQVAARELGIPRAYGSYEDLMADPSIEAVYNPLPNHLHVPLTLAAARAGKHVLCEKPIALRAQELEVLRPYASKVHIREAFMVHHHPAWRQVRDLVRRGAIGEPRFIQVTFSYFNVEPLNIRNDAAIGGGALYDIGCYAVVAGRWFFGADAQRAAAIMDPDPAFKTDRTTSGLIDFGAGRHLVFVVSTQAAPMQRIVVEGTLGRFEIEIPFNAPPDAATRYWFDDGSRLDGASRREHVVSVVDQYQLQAEAFSKTVRNEAPSVDSLDDAIANMRVIDALFRSAESGRIETV